MRQRLVSMFPLLHMYMYQIMTLTVITNIQSANTFEFSYIFSNGFSSSSPKLQIHKNYIGTLACAITIDKQN